MKTVSYELALRLKEVAEKHGVVLPDSYFIWYRQDCDKSTHIDKREESPNDIMPRKYLGRDMCDAHTADELMDWLPIYITLLNHGRFYLMIEKESDPFYFTVIYHQYNTPANYFENEILADALAQMAIWLIENGYVKGVGNE